MKKYLVYIFGLFFALFASFGLSSDSFAKQYNIVSSPILLDPLQYSAGINFEMYVACSSKETPNDPYCADFDSSDATKFNWRDLHFANLKYQAKDGREGCLFDKLNIMPSYSMASSVPILFNGQIYPDYWQKYHNITPANYNEFSGGATWLCHVPDLGANGLLLGNEDWFLSKDYPQNYTGIPAFATKYGWNKYWYESDSIFLLNRGANGGAGQKLDFTDFINKNYRKNPLGIPIEDDMLRFFPSFSILRIPLPHFDNSVVGTFGYGRQVHLQGEILFDFDSSQYQENGELLGTINDYISENNYVDFRLGGLTESDKSLKNFPPLYNAPVHYTDSNCTTDAHFNENKDEFPVVYDFACDMYLNFDYLDDFNVAFFTLGGNDFRSAPFLKLHPTYMAFESLSITFDDDWTPGGDIGSEVRGFDPSAAPGSGAFRTETSSNNSNSNLDFTGLLNQLASYFNFNFANPFDGIYRLFASGEQCVQFPQLADLIHSPTSEVCPFFDSKVRSILTPVFGFSSMMLLFGVIVHWLNKASGDSAE